MKKLILGSSFGTALLGFAQVAAAQPAPVVEKTVGFDISGIGGLITALNRIINYIIPFLIGLAVLVVIYGVFSFISNAADEEARANAKQFIIWGIIGIFIMLSVWGLVTILENSLNLSKDISGVTVPTVPGDINVE
ncbi:MAG: hypothetical protein HYV67_01900 [Candidatus Taylorbacteria bacterium]|nr:hypothetical protein [Candidatus Taylorbacteria bacterium]